MADKKDTIKLELPHAQAKALADIIHALANCLEPLSSKRYSNEEFPHKWKGIEYTTFADIKLLYSLDDRQTILRIEEHLKEGILFGYHFAYNHSTVLTQLKNNELPNSLTNRLYPSMMPSMKEYFPNIEEEYGDIMFFSKILTGMERSKPPRYEIDQTTIDIYKETATGLKSGSKNLLAYLYYCQGMSLTEIATTLSWSVDNVSNIRRNLAEGKRLAEENNLPSIHRYSK